MGLTPEAQMHNDTGQDEWENTQGMELDDSPTSIIDKFLPPMDAHLQVESQSRTPGTVTFEEVRSRFTSIRSPLFARSRAERQAESLDVMQAVENEESMPLQIRSRNYWDVVLSIRGEETVLGRADSKVNNDEEMRSHAAEDLEEEEYFAVISSVSGDVAVSVEKSGTTKSATSEDTGSSVTFDQSLEPNSHVDSGNPDAREMPTQYFICNLNGCEEILPKEFYKVRAHIRYSKLHIGGITGTLPTFPCPFEDCGYGNESMMRVAEHVCSDKHFNAKVKCYGRKCENEYNGRRSSLKRHRDGGGGKAGSCGCCEGCDSVFDSGVLRIEHEAQCTAARVAKADRLVKMKEEDKLEREEARRHRRMCANIEAKLQRSMKTEDCSELED